jgi:hypothetical protein
MRYVYEGPGPEEDGDGGIVRPLDVREFDAPPGWGLWRELAGGDPQQPPEPPSGLPQPPGLVPVADQRAAGAARGETVTMADQAAGAPLPATGTEG